MADGSRDPTTVRTDLYSGSPGVVLFFLELYQPTRDPRYLDLASRGADHLATMLSTEAIGPYEGLAGIGFTLAETFFATRRPEHERANREALHLVHATARTVGAGVEWNDTTDIISGSTGIDVG